MTRVAVAASTRLVADGIAAALAGAAGSQVELLPPSAGLTAAVSHGRFDALVAHLRDPADAAPLLAALPALPLVLVADEVHELALRGGGDARPLALLAADATPAQLRAALAAVLTGLAVREPALPWALPAVAGDHEPLTPRELEVFELLGKGLSNREIAGVLGISAHTAKYHVGQILAKVGAATRAEAVSAGLRLGVIGL
jgi:DNA-binding NarL/FixJ family response regulator